MEDRLKEEYCHIYIFKKGKISKGDRNKLLLMPVFSYSFLITNDYNYTFRDQNNSSNGEKYIALEVEQFRSRRGPHGAFIYSEDLVYNFVYIYDPDPYTYKLHNPLRAIPSFFLIYVLNKKISLHLSSRKPPPTNQPTGQDLRIWTAKPWPST